MGASGSKVAQQTARKFPTRAPGSFPAAATPKPPPSATPSTPSPSSSQPQSQQPQAFYSKEDALRADASSISQQQDPDDIPPDFAARLHKMGIVQPNPLWSPSSIANPFPHAIPKGPSLSPSAPSPPSAGSAPSGRERVVPSPSSRNVTLGVLEARRRLEAQATEQFERRGRASVDQGDELVDVGTLKRALVMRAAGTPAAEIEARLRLKKGVVARLGGVGVVGPAS